MEYLSEDHLKHLLNQEWLVKVDSDKSVPYLLKFHASTEDLSCSLMITDTKSVWGEVLSGNAFARRWLDCNASQSRTAADEERETEWRKKLLALLTDVHSIGGISDLSFDVVPSLNADFAFELGSDSFKWRWETYSLGPKVSAEVLSKQLIMPLISVSHLAFSSADPVSELSDTNLQMVMFFHLIMPNNCIIDAPPCAYYGLDSLWSPIDALKAIDKAGRTGRRAVDTHVKHALSRPRLATTMRRMSAVFNFLTDLPPVISKFDTPDFLVPDLPVSESVPAAPGSSAPSGRLRADSPEPSVDKLAHKVTEEPVTATVPASNSQSNIDMDSATEDEDDVPPIQRSAKGKHRDDSPDVAARPSVTPAPPAKDADSPYHSREPSPKRKELSTNPVTPDLNTESSAEGANPRKKQKRPAVVESSSDEDGETGPKRQAVKPKGAPRGAKQPIKRGGKRF